MAWPSKRVYGMELLGGRVYFLYDTAELSLCEEDLRWGTATWGGICAGIAAGLWLSWWRTGGWALRMEAWLKRT